MKKRNNFIGIFFKTLFIILGVCAFLIFTLVFAYDKLGLNEKLPDSLTKGNFMSNIFEVTPEKVNFVIMGTDEGGDRTDLVMVGTYKPNEGKISVISVPRDTKVVMPDERLKNAKSFAPKDGVMKLCEVSHFVEEEDSSLFLVKQLEEDLGVTFDYYAKVNLDAFKYLVDEIGGVEFNVPQRMYYTDPAQDLYIDLHEGVQVLDGDAAEGLVRYRKADIINPKSKGYINDSERMKVQQDFMKAVINQTLARENLLKNIPAITKTLYEHVETDFDIAEAPKYIKHFTKIDPSNIKFYTLPATSKKISNKSYQVLDSEESMKIINEVFYSVSSDYEIVDSKEYKIQILNGGYVNGLASTTKEILEEEGYTISSIGDYKGEKKDYTQILVKEEGMAEDLLKYFENADIEVSFAASDYDDIVIILGTNEK